MRPDEWTPEPTAEPTAAELHAAFARAYGERRYSAAARVFAQQAAQRHRAAVALARYDASLPSIIASFMPKSGGTFLHNRLLDAGLTEFWWCFPDADCFSHWYTAPRALRLFLGGGFACHTHFRPTTTLVEALRRARVRRVWVHLRNPAETAVSAFHHFRGEGHGGGELGAARRRQALEQAAAIGLSVEDKAAFLRRHIDWHIEWAAQWMRYERRRPGRVVFSYHTELVDTAALLERVFSRFGGRAPRAVSSTPCERDRFRPGRARTWRTGLPADVVRHVERRVEAGLGEFAPFARLCS